MFYTATDLFPFFSLSSLHPGVGAALGKWEKKFPLDSSRRIRALLNPFPLSQENVANSALQEGGRKRGEKSIYRQGILCFPAFPHPGGFLGCRGFYPAEIFAVLRFLGRSDSELPPNPFNSNLFRRKQRRRVRQWEWGTGS